MEGAKRGKLRDEEQQPGKSRSISMDESEQSQTAKMECNVMSGSNLNLFPYKLYCLLEEVEHDETPVEEKMILWRPHGKSFFIRDRKKFTETIIPRFFKRNSKFSSFQRQLNLYGFQRLYTGDEKGSYYHKLFRRDRPNLCRKICRTKVNGKQVRQPRNRADEPDFDASESEGESATESSTPQAMHLDPAIHSISHDEPSSSSHDNEGDSRWKYGMFQLSSITTNIDRRHDLEQSISPHHWSPTTKIMDLDGCRPHGNTSSGILTVEVTSDACLTISTTESGIENANACLNRTKRKNEDEDLMHDVTMKQSPNDRSKLARVNEYHADERDHSFCADHTNLYDGDKFTKDEIQKLCEEFTADEMNEIFQNLFT